MIFLTEASFPLGTGWINSQHFLYVRRFSAVQESPMWTIFCWKSTKGFCEKSWFLTFFKTGLGSNVTWGTPASLQSMLLSLNCHKLPQLFLQSCPKSNLNGLVPFSLEMPHHILPSKDWTFQCGQSIRKMSNKCLGKVKTREWWF